MTDSRLTAISPLFSSRYVHCRQVFNRTSRVNVRGSASCDERDIARGPVGSQNGPIAREFSVLASGDDMPDRTVDSTPMCAVTGRHLDSKPQTRPGVLKRRTAELNVAPFATGISRLRQELGSATSPTAGRDRSG